MAMKCVSHTPPPNAAEAPAIQAARARAPAVKARAVRFIAVTQANRQTRTATPTSQSSCCSVTHPISRSIATSAFNRAASGGCVTVL